MLAGLTEMERNRAPIEANPLPAVRETLRQARGEGDARTGLGTAREERVVVVVEVEVGVATDGWLLAAEFETRSHVMSHQQQSRARTRGHFNLETYSFV